ncbi:unnamed protein product [Phytomonas sp. Hart1]|nr:unnamed protein product [Phytomonas sp. Hart1]|eukprot:CCW69932.1 unnamed protein product [Phytomonas sp. isolate Hart1]
MQQNKSSTSSPSPPSFTELHSLVEKYLTQGSDVEGWQLDAIEKSPARFQVYPFFEHQHVGASFIYKDMKRGLETKFRWSNAWKSWQQYMPYVTYLFNKNGISHTLEFKAPMGTILYTLHHPAISAFWSCDLSSKGGGMLDLSTRICKQTCAGVSFLYDPFRSGLKDAVFLLTYANLSTFNCGNLSFGNLVTKYSLRNGLSLHLHVPVDPCANIVILAERNRFLAGLHTTLNKTAHLIANANFSDRSLTFTAIRNVSDIWKVSLTCNIPVMNTEKLSPKYGIKISNRDAED